MKMTVFETEEEENNTEKGETEEVLRVAPHYEIFSLSFTTKDKERKR